MNSFTVWLAKPRGFCRGVERAIKIAELAGTRACQKEFSALQEDVAPFALS